MKRRRKTWEELKKSGYYFIGYFPEDDLLEVCLTCEDYHNTMSSYTLRGEDNIDELHGTWLEIFTVVDDSNGG